MRAMRRKGQRLRVARGRKGGETNSAGGSGGERSETWQRDGAAEERVQVPLELGEISALRRSGERGDAEAGAMAEQ